MMLRHPASKHVSYFLTNRFTGKEGGSQNLKPRTREKVIGSEYMTMEDKGLGHTEEWGIKTMGSRRKERVGLCRRNGNSREVPRLKGMIE